jgi:hypothetical protein
MALDKARSAAGDTLRMMNGAERYGEIVTDLEPKLLGLEPEPCPACPGLYGADRKTHCARNLVIGMAHGPTDEDAQLVFGLTKWKANNVTKSFS